MQRQIVRFVTDDIGEWVAVLDCHHRQHVRHTPPFRVNPWVLDDRGRDGRLGTALDCPLCDRCELPSDLVLGRTTPTWDEVTVPNALRNDHRVAAGTWGRLRVEVGSLRFVAETAPLTDVEVNPGSPQPIPPGVEHHVVVDGPVRFSIDFLTPAG